METANRISGKIWVVLLIALILSSGAFVSVGKTPVVNAKGSDIFGISSNLIANYNSTTFKRVFEFKAITQQDIGNMLRIVEKNKNNSEKNVSFDLYRNMWDGESMPLYEHDYLQYRIHSSLGGNATSIIDGHGTGLRLPDKEELEHLLGHKMIVGVKNKEKGPSSLRWDLDPHFPPVGDQETQGSCVSWAVGYYQNGYLQRMIYNWTDDSPAHLMSPSWVYNKVNGGMDTGSYFIDNIQLIISVGEATLVNMSYDPLDYVSWGNESAWRDAPKHRILDYNLVYFNDDGVEAIKELLKEGYLVTFEIDAMELDKGFEDGNYIISSKEYDSTRVNHAQTIVGYDDNVTDDGDVGAFRIVNSWGTRWGDHGFYWLTYKALEEKVSQGWPYAYVLVPLSDKPYNPKLLATWHFSNPGSRDTSIEIYLSSDNSTNYRIPIWNGGTYEFPNFMALDITKLYNDWKNSSYSSKFYLKIGSGKSSSIIDSFRIEYYPYGYRTLWQNSTESPDVPVRTPARISSAPFAPSDYTPSLYIKLKDGMLPTYIEDNKSDLIVGNAGNKIDTISLMADAANGWKVKIGCTGVTLKPGHTGKISLYVTPNERDKPGATSTIEITATSQNNPDKKYILTFTALYSSKPVYIRNNTDLHTQAALHGWPGNGSAENPYIISDLFIYKEALTGIYVSFTDAYIVIENSNITGFNGIYIDHAKNIKLSNNFINGKGGTGIMLNLSSNITIEGNEIQYDIFGVFINSSTNSTLVGSTLSNMVYGVVVVNGTSIDLYNNEISTSKISGIIFLHSSKDNIIKNNKICNALFGLDIWYSDNDILESNEICRNRIDGLRLYYSENDRVKNNKIYENGNGIALSNSSYNILYRSLILNNRNYGVYIFSGFYNLICNNSFYYNLQSTDDFQSHTIQAYDGGSNNSWNSTTVGNYWQDWTHNNDTNDKDGDGIIDWPYIIVGPARAEDHYPLKNPAYSIPPLPPQHFSAQAGDRYVNLTWYAPRGMGTTPLKEYRVYRDGYLIAKLPITQLYYNDTSVVNGQRYSYYLTAVNSIGESERTSIIKVTPMTVPSPPKNLTAKSGDRYINLTWEAPVDDGGSAITQYHLYRNDSLLSTLPPTISWYNITNLTNGIVYTFYLTAVNSVGESDKSNIVTVIPMTVPSPPQNLTARAGNRFVFLTWNRPADVGGSLIENYKVYRNNVLIATVDGLYLYYNDTTVTNGKNYSYYVTAVNEVGESDRSNLIYATPLGPPSSPQGLHAYAGYGYINLSWEAPIDDGGAAIEEYRIYRNGSLVANVSATQLWYNDTDVRSGVNYTYYITAVNSVGESEPSNEIQAKPKIPPNKNFNYIWILLATVLVIIAGVVVWTKRRKYKHKP